MVPIILGAVELLWIEHHILLYGENQWSNRTALSWWVVAGQTHKDDGE